MEIGDKVRFLNEVGGGRIAGFQGKDIVLVEDADGFEIPMLRNEVVVIETDDYNIAKVSTGASPRTTSTSAGKSAKGNNLSRTDEAMYGFDNEKPSPQQPKRILSDDEDYDPADRPVTFKAKPQERPNGNLLNVYLGFLESENQVGVDENDRLFDTYVINDCNYYLNVVFMSAEGASWKVRYQACIEPNTKQFVESFKRSELPSMEHLCLQCLAYKQDKPFQLKPAASVQLRLDQVKFYKTTAFQPSPFFRQPALTVDVIRDDRPVRGVFVNAEELQEALLTKKKPQQGEASSARVATSAKKAQKNMVEIDLHIDKLLDDLTGMSAADILKHQMQEFRRVMDENVNHMGRKIVFIHGKGDGVLRKNIIQELKYRYKRCKWQDASFQEYGYGATLVKIG